MHGIWIALSCSLSEVSARDCLRRWFPDVETLTRDDALAAARDPWPPIVFSVDVRPEVPDFPTYVAFDCFPGPARESVEVGISLAQRFSGALGCRALCDGTGHGDDAGPYWAIVCDRGAFYLCDDAGTELADGTGGPVRVVRAIDVAPRELGADGRLML